MNNRATNLLLLVVIVLLCYWFWKQPETHGDAERVKDAIAAIPDKVVEGAAKVSNRIEDANIPEKTEKALDNAGDKIKETGNEIKEDFNDAKRRDRAEGN